MSAGLSEIDEIPAVIDRRYSAVCLLGAFFRCLLWRQTIVTRHPVRKNVVDRGGLDQTSAASKQQEWTALPEEIRVDALVDRNWTARPIGAAWRILASQINPVVAARPPEPQVQERDCLVVAHDVLSLQG